MTLQICVQISVVNGIVPPCNVSVYICQLEQQSMVVASTLRYTILEYSAL